jgi:hypothetical protein
MAPQPLFVQFVKAAMAFADHRQAFAASVTSETLVD